jgi:hypothetical protein
MSDMELITASHQIICEGPDDIALFCRIVRDRNIPDTQVSCGRKIDGTDRRCLGTSGFLPRLRALKDLPQPKQRGFVIVADTDDDPTCRFTYACNQFRKAGLPVPTTAYSIKTEPGQPKTAVILIPDEDHLGGIESILLNCAAGVDAARQHCRDHFFDCIDADNWAEKNQHKLRLRLLIAGTKEDDPSMGISIWLSSAERPFTIQPCNALDRIANFLADFVAAPNP